MKPDPRFVRQPPEFWAHVRTISQKVGYTNRKTKEIGVPSYADISNAFNALGLNSAHIATEKGKPTKFGNILLEYFQFRADTLNKVVQRQLMNADEAKSEFEKLRADLNPTCYIPMNKQKEGKKRYNFSPVL